MPKPLCSRLKRVEAASRQRGGRRKDRAAGRGCEKARPARVQDEDEEVEAENAKDGVSLDELFKMKPEIFPRRTTEEEDAEKKKGKKKKKGVEFVLDEELGEVVGRKKHKRGDDDSPRIDEYVLATRGLLAATHCRVAQGKSAPRV